MEKINLTLYESSLPLENTNNLWADIDEDTKELLAIHRYNHGIGNWEPYMVSVDYMKPDEDDDTPVGLSITSTIPLNTRGTIPVKVHRLLSSWNDSETYNQEEWVIELPEGYEVSSDSIYNNIAALNVDVSSRLAMYISDGDKKFSKNGKDYIVKQVFFYTNIKPMTDALHRVAIVTKAQFEQHFSSKHEEEDNGSPIFNITVLKNPKTE